MKINIQKAAGEKQQNGNKQPLSASNYDTHSFHSNNEN